MIIEWIISAGLISIIIYKTENELNKNNYKNKKSFHRNYDEKWKNEKNILKKGESQIKKTTKEEKIKKGKEYEEYIAKIYRNRGYHVTEYGKIKGRKDKGIDLIAKKEKELILIQCKNWNENTKWKITHKEIKTFQTEARLFVENKPLLIKSDLKARYILSGNFIHQSAVKHLEEIQKKGKKVDYEIINMI